MKRYRNKIKGPLSVGLKSGSISVGAKGYFNVDGDDLNSPDLLTKVRMGQLEFIEEVIVIPVEDKAPPKDKLESKVEPIVQPKDEPKVELEADMSKVEKVDDTLTSSSKMVESKDIDSKDDKESAKGKDKKKRSIGSKTKNKKGITGE